jgi:hypothetical protein
VKVENQLVVILMGEGGVLIAFIEVQAEGVQL